MRSTEDRAGAAKPQVMFSAAAMQQAREGQSARVDGLSHHFPKAEIPHSTPPHAQATRLQVHTVSLRDVM